MRPIRIRSLVLTALALLSIAIDPSSADGQAEARPGERVRMWIDRGPRVTGRLTSIVADSVVVEMDGGGARTIPASQVWRVEVRRKAPDRSAVLGMLIGIPLGALAGGTLASRADEDDEPGCGTTRSCGMPPTVAGAMAGAALGGAVGGGVGLLFPGSRWVHASLGGPASARIGVAPGVDGGVAVHVNLTL